MKKRQIGSRWETGKIKKGNLCPYCGRYYSRDIAADSLVIKNGKVLLIKRHQETREGGKWALPGGILEWNETLEECALKELKEETGVIGKIIKFFKIYSNPQREPDDTQNVTAVYLVHFIKEVEKIDKKEVEKKAWFTLESLPKKIAFDHRKIIKDYIKSKRL